MQFLQVTFGNGISFAAEAPLGAECISVGGSTSASENAGGFCLVSDLITTAMGSANFSIANDLPVTSWEFLQVPSKDATPVSGFIDSPLDASSPVGIVVSNFAALPLNLPFQDDFGNTVDPLTQYFHISNQTSGMEAYSTLYWRNYPNLALWLGR